MIKRLPLLLISFLVLADQGTKYLAYLLLDYAYPLPITPFLNFTLVYNSGIAFSLFDDGGQFSRIFFTSFNFIFVIGAVIYLQKINQKAMRYLIYLMIAGALGNGIDRLLLGYVIDFLDFHFYGWHYPTFNLADSYISIGVFLLICSQLIKFKRN